MQQIEIRRQRILDAALEVFSEKGFHQATVAEVAEKAHVGKGTVYLYFEGKEALLVSIFDTLVDRVLQALDQILDGNDDPREAVQWWVARQMGNRRAGRLIPQLLAQHPFLSSLALERERGSLLNRAVEKVAERIRAAIDRGTVRSCDPTLAACVLLCLPAAIPFYGAANSDVNLMETMAAMAEGLTDILWFGLRKEWQR